MKIQSLAIIFVIIILPISLVLSAYTKTRVETLNLQAQYDTKLDSATYDALKAYQMNSFQSKTGDFTNSKIRDIKASVNTFFNSMSTNFSTLGYTKESLQNYVPAIVYTMYDGYYIYAPFENTWDINDQVNKGWSGKDDVSEEMKEQIIPSKREQQKNYKEYQDGATSESGQNSELIYGLKPYVYYSCRYKTGNTDVVITYSLDNYIQIQGLVDGTPVSKYGYLISNIVSSSDDNVTIGTAGANITIGKEGNIKEMAYYTTDATFENNDKEKTYDTPQKITGYCIKRNGTKYYVIDSDQGIGGGARNQSNLYYILNQKLVKQTSTEDLNANTAINNNNAIKYYKEANELKQFIESTSLKNLTVNDAVDIESGKRYEELTQSEKDKIGKTGQNFTNLNGHIFDFDNNIESEQSNFNIHRRDVIKNSIERNLAIVIANFDKEAGSNTEFRLPKLKDTDWDKIMDNIGIITFMQGANIGGKTYSGYSIVSNTENEDVVTYDSIYIKIGDECNRVTQKNLSSNLSGAVGIYNVNTESRPKDDANSKNGLYFPIYAKLSYTSIVTRDKDNIADKAIGKTTKEYISELLSSGSSNEKELARIFYTALARERYGIYRPKLNM